MRFFERQGHHLVALVLLLVGVAWLADEGALAGQLGGVSTRGWLLLAIAVPVLHQLYVWLVWRLQLDGRRFQKAIGENAFTLYAVGFTILFVGRLISVILLAISNRGTLSLPPALAYLLALLLLFPVLYLFYSVRTYFGFKRPYGIDHFDPTYRSLGLVRQGIFRWTSNAMYVFGLLALWIPGLLLLSKGALLVAAFNHLYIWVHYYTTEQPDMEYIYGGDTVPGVEG